MSERDALSSEISWYKEPQITDYRYYGEMTGKDIISICNNIIAENKQKEDDQWVVNAMLRHIEDCDSEPFLLLDRGNKVE